MGIQVIIPTKVIYYTQVQHEDWVNGKREGCTDPYCKGLPRSYGFGESIVGSHFEEQNYNWIHHDYNVFGGNKPGKYPFAEEVITKCIGIEKFNSVRTLYKAYRNIEEPDLLIYKPDYSEIRFAESKRLDTKDQVREEQIRGLALFALLFGAKAEVYVIAEEGSQYEPKPIIWEF